MGRFRDLLWDLRYAFDVRRAVLVVLGLLALIGLVLVGQAVLDDDRGAPPRLEDTILAPTTTDPLPSGDRCLDADPDELLGLSPMEADGLRAANAAEEPVVEATLSRMAANAAVCDGSALDDFLAELDPDVAAQIRSRLDTVAPGG